MSNLVITSATIYYKNNPNNIEIDNVIFGYTPRSLNIHSYIYFDERHEMLMNNEYMKSRVLTHEQFFDAYFAPPRPAPMQTMVYDYERLFNLSSRYDIPIFYSYHGEHIPSDLRDNALLNDPLAKEFFIRHPEQSVIPPILIPKVMAGRIKPFVKQQLSLLPSANANHATIYKLLLHQWLTASLDEANFTLERAAIFEKILAYGIDQFSADVSASRIWGGVLSPTAYRQPATGNWTLSYSDGNALATDDTMLANAGLASDPNSNYSKAYSIVYPPTEPLGRGD